MIPTACLPSSDNVVDTQAGHPRIVVRFPDGAKHSSPLQSVPNGSSNLLLNMQCGGFPQWVKVRWRQHDDAPPGAKVKNECAQSLASIHGRTVCRTHYMCLFLHRIHIFTGTWHYLRTNIMVYDSDCGGNSRGLSR